MEPSTSTKEERAKEPPEEPERISFQCSRCAMSELVDYFGRNPPFIRNLELIEDSYVMKDPFTAPPTRHGTRSFTEYFIVIGSNCISCRSTVCKDCSLFYKSTFCYSCAQSQIHKFPLEVQSKIRKEVLAIKNR